LTASFDPVFAAEDIRVIKTPSRAPRADAICERVIGTVRRECLDRILILRRRPLGAVLSEYVDDDNSHPPDRSLTQHAPSASDTTADVELAKLRRTDAWEGSSMNTGWLPEPGGRGLSAPHRSQTKLGEPVLASRQAITEVGATAVKSLDNRLAL
jgi:hypothetical protein